MLDGTSSLCVYAAKMHKTWILKQLFGHLLILTA